MKMGYIKHHAITVTSWEEKAIKKARLKAVNLFQEGVSEIVKSRQNSWYTFLIAPDGSKEGWDASIEGDNDRKKYIQWVKNQAYDDGSNVLSFIEYFYGEDNGYAEVVNHN